MKTIQVDIAGRLVSAIVKTAADVQLSASTYNYDPHGRLQSSTDGRNGATTFIYFNDDQINTVTTPDPDTTQLGGGYDPQTTTYAYDTAGRVSTVTQPDASAVNTTFWPTGAVKRKWGSRIYPSEYAYDTQLRVKTLTTWQNYAGNSGQAVTTWNYNSLRGWLDNKRYSDSTGPNYTYKPSGRLLTRTWARGLATTYSYNAAGDLSGVSYSDTTPAVTFAFDRSGRNKIITDAAGVCNWTYHASGQLQNESYTSGLLNGQTITRGFDAYYRPSQLGGASLSTVTYGYDDASRLQTVTQGTNTATYAYLTNSSLAQSVTFTQGGTSRLTTSKAYDFLNRLSSITNTPSADTARSYIYSYNAANQRTRALREDGSHWDYTYDALGQVTSAKKVLPDTTTLLGTDSTWTFDDIGNRKTATTSAQTFTYTSNLLNQYSQRTVPATVDVFGAAASDATVTVNGAAATRQGLAWYANVSTPNSYVPVWARVDVSGLRPGGGPGGTDAVASGTRHVFVPKTPEVYTYDLDGNLTSDGQWTYTWDAENRMIACETQAGILPPSGPFPLSQRRKLEFVYDAQGRRVSKKVSSWNGTAYVLDTQTLVSLRWRAHDRRVEWAEQCRDSQLCVGHRPIRFSARCRRRGWSIGSQRQYELSFCDLRRQR